MKIKPHPLLNQREGRSTVVHPDVTFVALALVVALFLLYLGRSLTFLHDEWRFVGFRGDTLDYLRPVNEHWSTFPLLLYRMTFEVIELRSYLPYIAQVVVLHVIAVSGAYVLMRRRLGPLWATIISLPLLLLGAGSENLFWAFQTGFVGSVLFGVWALVAVESVGRLAVVITSTLLLGAVVSSGIGLFFIVVVAARTLFCPELRSRALCVAVPVAAYALWYAAVGRAGNPSDLADTSVAAEFALRGVAHASAAMSGAVFLPAEHAAGAGAFVAVVAVTAVRLNRGRDCTLAVACVLGLVAFYAVLGLVRAQLGVDFATQSRYAYVAAFLLVLAFVDLLPRERLWRGANPNRGVTAAVLLLVALSLVANLDALDSTQREFQYAADRTRAFIDIALTRRTEPWVDKNARLGLAPAIGDLASVVRQSGSPLNDSIVPSVARPPAARAYEDAMLIAVGDRFRVQPTRERGNRLAVQVRDSRDVDIVETRGSCRDIRGTGREPTFTVMATPGSRLRLRSRSAHRGSLLLGYAWPPSRRIPFALPPDSWTDVVVPAGSRRVRGWQVRFDMPSRFGTVTLCAVRLALKY